MNKILYNLILAAYCFLCSSASPSQLPVKEVSIFNNSISVEVPSVWKPKINYQKYSYYNKIFNEIISDKAALSYLKSEVFSARYREGMSVDTVLLNEEEKQLVHGVNKQVVVESKDLITKSGVKVGCIKYTFLNYNNKKCYGISCFFKDAKQRYYAMEIASYNKGESEFRKVAEMILNSVTLHFSHL